MASRRSSVPTPRSGHDAEEVRVLMAASKIVSAAIAHSFATTDAKVTLPQLRVLVMLRDTGPMNMSAVAEGLGVNPSNASRTCDRLVRSGLLDRRDAPEDRRNVALTLTAAGRRLVDAMLRQREVIFGQVIDRMSERQRSQLVAGLAAFNEVAHELSTEGGGVADGEGHLLRWLS